MAFRKAKVKELYEHYRRNFKKYGIGIETGSLTGLFNIYWMHRKGIDTLNYSCRDTEKVDFMTNNLEFYIVPDYLEYHIETLSRGLTQRVIFDDSIRALFDKNTKRKMLKDEEAALNGYRPIIEQRFSKYIEFSKHFRDQMKVRYTPVNYTTSRRSILYNEKGPYWARDFRRVLSHDPKEPQYYLGMIYLQGDLIDHIRENFEAAWANSIGIEPDNV
jgi:transcriptional accessory protein Tex/SPT6